MEGSKISPSSYAFKDIKLTNIAGDVFNIVDLVQEVEIIESIYFPSLLYSFTIVDAADFFSFAKISGNEKISFTLEKRRLDEVQLYEKECIVTDIPMYARPKSHVQVYKLNAISPHQYQANITRLSRKLFGSVSGIIRNLVEGDLRSELAVFNANTSDNIKGIIPNFTITNTINWLLKRSFDEQKRPVYFWETLFDGLHLESLTSMRANVQEGLYKQMSFFTKEAHVDPNNDITSRDFEEEQYRIIDLSSEMGLAKLDQTMDGVFGSRTLELDPSTKSFRTYDFRYRNDRDLMYNDSFFSDNLTVGNRRLNQYPNSKRKTVIKSRELYDDYSEYNEHFAESFGKFNSLRNNLDAMTHELTLTGDVELHPGKVIDILIRKAIDPNLEDLGEIDGSMINDQYLSGQYMIIANTHTFKNNRHVCRLKLGRDSSPVPMETVA